MGLSSSMRKTWQTLKRSSSWCVFPRYLPGDHPLLADGPVVQIQGQTAVSNDAYEGRSEIFLRKTFTLWRKLESSGPCPRATNFQIPFSSIESRRVGVERLPPSYACELGQGGRISCSYSMHVNVTQKPKHGFWTNHNRYVCSSRLPSFPVLLFRVSWRLSVWCGIFPLSHPKGSAASSDIISF